MDAQIAKKMQKLVAKGLTVPANKIRGILADVKDDDIYTKAYALVGKAPLDEKMTALIGGTVAVDGSHYLFDEDGNMYTDDYVSTLFLFGTDSMYVYSHGFSLTGVREEERFVDFPYREIVGIEQKTEKTAHTVIVIKKKKKQTVQTKTNTGYTIVKKEIIVKTKGGDCVFSINTTANVDKYLSEVRSYISARKN